MISRKLYVYPSMSQTTN